MVAIRHDISYPLLCFQHALENEELTQHLGAAKDAQRQLTAEVGRSTPFHHKRETASTDNCFESRYQPGKTYVHLLPPVLCLSVARVRR